MKNTKRGLSILLAIALLITSVGVGLGTGILKSEIPAVETVSKTGDSNPIHFYVPETIYLKPTEGNATIFEHYVDSSNSQTPLLDKSKVKTTGNVYFYCANATEVSISCSGATVTMGATTGSTTISTAISGGTLTSGLAQKGTRLLTWTATYTVAGQAMTAKAYTICYAPPIEAIGVNQSVRNTDGTASGDEADLQGLFYVSGVQGYSGSSTGYFNQTSGNMVCPMLGNVTNPNGGNTQRVDWQTGSSGGIYHGDWSGGDDNYSLVKLSPTGSLAVDTSRYTDINQVPNFTCGMIIYNTWHMDELYYYICDYDEGTSYITDTQTSGSGNLNTIFNATGSQILFGDTGTNRSRTTSIVYGGTTGGNVYSNEISGTGTYAMRLKAAAKANNSGEWNVFSSLVNVNVSKVNKGTLRNNIRYYTNLGLQAADYSNDAADFAAYQNELAAAAARLGNPTDTSTSDTLGIKYAALTKNTYTATVNHIFSSGQTTVVETQVFNSGETVNFAPNTYTGYNLDSAYGYTTSTASQSVKNRRGNLTQNYYYTSIESTVTFDAQGGTVSPGTKSVNYGSTYGAGTGGWPTPVWLGHTFDGWYTGTGGSGTQIFTGTTVAITAAQTLYAKGLKG